MEEIGTIISTLESPSPSRLDFVVNKEKVSLHRGQFIQADYSEGTLIALITDLIKTNKYFERADSVKEFEANGSKLFEQFPVNEWEYLVARCKPLGVFKDGFVKRTTHPVSPGTKVCLADKEKLKVFLGLKDKGIHLGDVEHHGLKLELSMNRLIKKHLAILGISGCGKSHSVTVLLEELLERNKEDGRIAALLFDVHGEYTHLAEPNPKGKDFSSKVNLVNANEITIAVPKLSVFMLSSIVPEMGSIQRRELGRIIDRLQKQMRDGLGPYGFNEIKAEIAKDKEVKENTAQALIGWINELESMNLFGRTDNPSIQELVQPGTLTIIDLSDLINLKKKQTIVTYFLQKLFNDRRKGFCAPFIAIIEEAHQFAPEKASRESAISKSIIQTIAREGRKFLAGICLISQRPVQLSTTALSQCNTHLIMKVSNPYDLDHIGKSSESLDRQSLDMISSLRVGEALLVGEATNFPVFFKVRQRKSRESRHEKTLEEAAFEFEEKTKARNEEAKEFI